MVSEETFIGEQFRFKTSDVIEFITAYEDSFPAVLLLEKVTGRNNLRLENLFLQVCKIDADRQATNPNETVVQHTSLINRLDRKNS